MDLFLSLQCISVILQLIVAALLIYKASKNIECDDPERRLSDRYSGPRLSLHLKSISDTRFRKIFTFQPLTRRFYLMGENWFSRENSHIYPTLITTFFPVFDNNIIRQERCWRIANYTKSCKVDKIKN